MQGENGNGGFRRSVAGMDPARNGFTLLEVLLVIVILGILATIASHPVHAAMERARVARAIAEISLLQREIAAYETGGRGLPAALADVGRSNMLDPWNRPYVYFPFPSAGAGGGGGSAGGGRGGGGGGGGAGIAGSARKDRFLVPINSTYDLYSMGADGQSTGPLTASVSRDDVIRANDGAYIGLASGY